VNLRKLSELVVAVAAMLALWTALPGVAVVGVAMAQNSPGPTDETKLYEAAKKEGTVVWYGGSPPEPMRAMAADFEAKYPGVKVQIIRLIGLAQYQRFMLETQAHQYVAYVLHIGDEPSMVDLINRGYVADWQVPTYDRVPAYARIKDNAYAAWINDVNVAYNPNSVTPDEVKLFAHDWHGLLDPRFKGRLAVTDQPCGTCFALIQMFLNSKYKDQFGVKFLQALMAQEPTVYSDVAVPADRVIAGEQDIYVMSGEGVNYSKWLQQAPLQWVHPSPTPAFGNTWFGISKFAPHPNAARLFVDWMMSEDGAKSIQTKYGALNTLSGYADSAR
jgi:iron(III) transport system substrate-binding protein